LRPSLRPSWRVPSLRPSLRVLSSLPSLQPSALLSLMTTRVALAHDSESRDETPPIDPPLQVTYSRTLFTRAQESWFFVTRFCRSSRRDVFREPHRVCRTRSE
jgi:hypothetical protein